MPTLTPPDALQNGMWVLSLHPARFCEAVRGEQTRGWRSPCGVPQTQRHGPVNISSPHNIANMALGLGPLITLQIAPPEQCRGTFPGFGTPLSARTERAVNVVNRYDEESDLAEGLNIKVVPQFYFYKGGNLVERFATREKMRVADAINKHAGEGTVDMEALNRKRQL